MMSGFLSFPLSLPLPSYLPTMYVKRRLLSRHLLLLVVLFWGAVGWYSLRYVLRSDRVDHWPVRFHDTHTPVPGGDVGSLFWMAQVSDVHLSIHSPTRTQDFHTLCCDVFRDVIQPELVVVTGDLTDAKLLNRFHSIQLEDEWKTYRRIVEECGWFDPNKWLDVPGNHDRYNVPDPSSPINFFPTYSVQGVASAAAGHPRPPALVSLTHRTSFGRYHIIGLDTNHDLGFSYPFLLLGAPSTPLLDGLELDLKEHAHDNATLVASHYPIGALLAGQSSTHRSLEEIVTDKGSRVRAHLSGHFHVRDAYVRGSSGLQDLELADFKFKRFFRLLAFDHDLLSFVDVTLGTFPIVLVTNPKDARFLSSQEPLSRIAFSTHIRCLVFSDVRVVSVTFSLDGREVKDMHQAPGEDRLFVAPWNPHDVGSGLHKIEVVAQDAKGRTSKHSHEFSIDGTAALMGMSLTQFQIRIKLMVFLPLIFGLAYLYLVAVAWGGVIVERILRRRGLLASWENKIHTMLQAEDGMVVRDADISLFPRFGGVSSSFQLESDDAKFSMRPALVLWQAEVLLYRFMKIARTIPGMFLLGCLLYLPWGPWLVGPVTQDVWGSIFAWGAIVKGSYIQLPEVFFHGSVLLILVVVPFATFLSIQGYEEHRTRMTHQRMRCRHASRLGLWSLSLAALVLLVTTYVLVTFCYGYGFYVFLTPVFFWIPVFCAFTVLRSVGCALVHGFQELFAAK